MLLEICVTKLRKAGGGWNIKRRRKDMKIRYQREERKAEGEMPVSFLKYRLKFAGSLKPSL